MPLSPLEAIQQVQDDAATLHTLVGALSVWNVLKHDGVLHSHTGDTVETELARVTVPAGSMGPNGLLRITTLWGLTNNGNNKTLRVRFPGIGGTQFLSAVLTAHNMLRHQISIANRNAENSQIAAPATMIDPFGTVDDAGLATAIDTTVDQDIVFTGELANAGDTINLHDILVELLHGD